MARDYRHHTLDIYDTELHAARSKKGWKKMRKDLTFLDKHPSATGHTGSALWVPTKAGVAKHHVSLFVDYRDHGEDLPALANTCAHEALHGALRIMEHIRDEAPNAERDEPLAYLTGWLTGWLYEMCTL